MKVTTESVKRCQNFWGIEEEEPTLKSCIDKLREERAFYDHWCMEDVELIFTYIDELESELGTKSH